MIWISQNERGFGYVFQNVKKRFANEKGIKCNLIFVHGGSFRFNCGERHTGLYISGRERTHL